MYNKSCGYYCTTPTFVEHFGKRTETICILTCKDLSKMGLALGPCVKLQVFTKSFDLALVACHLHHGFSKAQPIVVLKVVSKKILLIPALMLSHVSLHLHVNLFCETCVPCCLFTRRAPKRPWQTKATELRRMSVISPLQKCLSLLNLNSRYTATSPLFLCVCAFLFPCSSNAVSSQLSCHTENIMCLGCVC